MLTTSALISLLFAIIATVVFSYKRLLVYHRYFQQEEYDSKRFISWLVSNVAFDKRGTALVAIAFSISLLTESREIALFLYAFLLFGLTLTIKDSRKHGKIKLKMTARATRIFTVAAALYLIAYAVGFLFLAESYLFPLHIFLFQLLPLTLLLSNLLLSPIEKATKQKYYNEAKEILARVDPFVIGITGSYGKTSVKAALAEVLNAALAPTFTTQRSINTVMGITREIREKMTEHHKYAVIEMGAYNVGSIQRLCDFTPPSAAIVTVVGKAHLERYGSVEAIYHAKSELPQNVPDSGMLICNGDNEGSRRMTVEFPKEKTYLYGFEPERGHLDCLVKNMSFTFEGTEFELDWQGVTYKGLTKLLGKPAMGNLLAVFTTACALGADPAHVLAAIRNIEPVNNRLELKKEGEVYYINDAYNSNPLGFEAALDVLAGLPAKRRVLMTPGMIELGPDQEMENKKVAQYAAGICDHVILVSDTNVEALLAGLEQGGMAKKDIIVAKTRDEAFTKLHDVIQPGDMILLENDLPDLYEVEERF